MHEFTPSLPDQPKVQEEKPGPTSKPALSLHSQIDGEYRAGRYQKQIPTESLLQAISLHRKGLSAQSIAKRLHFAASMVSLWRDTLPVFSREYDAAWRDYVNGEAESVLDVSRKVWKGRRPKGKLPPAAYVQAVHNTAKLTLRVAEAMVPETWGKRVEIGGKVLLAPERIVAEGEPPDEDEPPEGTS